MRRLLVLPLVLVAGATAVVHATDATDAGRGSDPREEIRSILAKQEIALADLFRLAELTSPTLAHARSSVRVEAGRARQAGLYPNPTVEFEVEELETRDLDLRKDKVALVQPLVISGRRGAAVAVAQAEQASAGHVLQQTRRDIFRRIHRLWAEQLYFRDSEASLSELHDVADRTLEIAQTRFDARAAPESQVTKALLEVYDLEVAQQQLTQERVRGTAELIALFGGEQVPLDRLVGTLEGGSVSTGLESDAEHTVEDHPALRAAKKDIDSAAATLREAKAARIPDLDLFFAYGQFRPADVGFVEAGISIPLPLFDRNQGHIAESQALVAQAEQRVRIVESDLAAALAVVRQRYHTTREQLEALLNRIAPAAERGLAQAQEGYRVGRLPFLELVDAQRTLANVRRRTLELRRDLIVEEAAIMSLTGAGPYREMGEE
jgi:cobalt-zinc-cadmium efflux system outer membrane protein